jgi:hypothetical protein
MHIFGAILLSLLLLPLPAWSKDVPLFFIQRSTNRNEVHYQLRVDDRCHIVADKPVSGFWKRWEKNPMSIDPLTVLDQIAYGIVQQTVQDNWVSFSLKALEQKRIKASVTATPQPGACSPIVHTEIQGQWAALERIYVQVEEGFIKPKVVYVDVFGKSLDAGATPMRERITP